LFSLTFDHDKKEKYMAHYIPLDVRSSHSIGESICQIPRLVSKAKQMGMEALALTDWRCLFGAKEFHDACIASLTGAEKSTIKPILGLSALAAYGGGHYPVEILAKNRLGYLNLIQLASVKLNEDNCFSQVIPFDEIENYSEGLICLSSAADASFVKGCRLLFGDDFVFLARSDEDDFSRWPSILVCAAKPVRFLERDDAEVLDLYRARFSMEELNGPEVAECKRAGYLLSDDELASCFPRHPEWIENTIKLSKRIEYYDLDSDPDFALPGIPKAFSTANGYLRHLVLKGAVMRWGGNVPKKNMERLEYELSVIEHADIRSGGTEPFANYFLMVSDFVEAAKRMGIRVGPGRGPAVGAAVAYALGITSVDPIRNGLLFERFINEDNPSLPDIDVDVEDIRRKKIVDYLVGLYGREHVAEIMTRVVLGPRSAIQEFGCALGLSDRKVNALANQVSLMPRMTMAKALSESTHLQAIYDDVSRPESRVLRVAEKLEECQWSRGVHACGVAVSRKALADNIPIFLRDDLESLPLTQYTARELESVGLARFDILGFRVLSNQARVLLSLASRGETAPDLDAIPEDDLETLRVFETGDTEGVFQFESEKLKSFLVDMNPLSFSDLVAVFALFRPGVFQKIQVFIRRKRGKEIIAYDHPLLAEYLGETYGLIVYQEQIMQLAQRLANFGRGLSDTLRKALAYRRPEELATLRSRFLEGCLVNPNFRNGECADEVHAREVAANIWAMFEQEGPFAFNKSHALAYVRLAYQCAFLKAKFRNDFVQAFGLEDQAANRHKERNSRMTIKNVSSTGKKGLLDWERTFYDAGNPKHLWKKGYSAQALAEFILLQNGEETIKNAVNAVLVDDPVVRFTDAEIECKCPFDRYSKPRQQDLGIWGETRSGKIVFVGVEAKVNETFGKTMEDRRRLAEEYRAKHENSKQVARIDELCNKFGVKFEEVGGLRYQLFHFAAGTACMSKDKGGKEISARVMLVLVLETECYSPKKGENNKNDFNRFMARFFQKVSGGWRLREKLQRGLNANLYATYLSVPHVSR